MARDQLIPIRLHVKYGPKNGTVQHLWPELNQVDAALRDNMDWCHFLDKFGGWITDKLSGHGQVDAGNPDPDTWICCALLPEDFVNAAKALFPAEIEIIDEATIETFYNNRFAVKLPSVHINEDAMKVVAELRAQGVPDTDPRIAPVIDSANAAPGLNDNPLKTWAGFKTKKGVDIKTSLRK